MSLSCCGCGVAIEHDLVKRCGCATWCAFDKSDTQARSVVLKSKAEAQTEQDISYLHQAEAHADEGPLGEPAARSILKIALRLATPKGDRWMDKPVPDQGVVLTDVFKAMNGLQKWETLVLNGLIGTDEPWIEAMRDTLREDQAKITVLAEGLEDALEDLLDGETNKGVKTLQRLLGQHKDGVPLSPLE